MFRYNSIQEIVDLANEKGVKISELVMEDQAKQFGYSVDELYKEMEKAFDVMIESTHTGMDKDLRSTSGLTGGEGYKVMEYAKNNNGGFAGDFMTRSIARAMATSNTNAAMGKILATPTAGSCGILPGVLVTLYEDEKIEKEVIVKAIFTAGAFGMVVAKQASISGAEGGCQAECGSASGMAAAAIVEIKGGTPQQSADALGMCVINQLGLVCDPVAGLVEIPCIKRNASGVSIAISSASMALAGVDLYIPVDETLVAMKQVGDAMRDDLKETARGGLASTPTGKKLMEQVFGKENN